MTIEHDYAVESSIEEFRGFRFSIARDRVSMPGGTTADRIYMRHPGSVAAVAIDDDNRVALIWQYRHPARQRLWELPAGLRDVEGEDPAVTAGRELAEEIDMVAGRMDFLLDVFPSPGCNDERIQIYLATELTPVPPQRRHVRTDEEAELKLQWWDLDEAVSAALSGGITNGAAVTGILAAAAVRSRAA